MEELYLKSLELLDTSVAPIDPKELEIHEWLKGINFVDMDKGQIDQYNVRPAIGFPACLIKIEIIKSEDMGNDIQKCTARVSFRLAFDYVGSTASHTPSEALQESLSYFKIVNAVYRKFQGYFGGGFSRFSRISLNEEKRSDGYKVVAMPFTTSFIDYSAVRN